MSLTLSGALRTFQVTNANRTCKRLSTWHYSRLESTLWKWNQIQQQRLLVEIRLIFNWQSFNLGWLKVNFVQVDPYCILCPKHPKTRPHIVLSSQGTLSSWRPPAIRQDPFSGTSAIEHLPTHNDYMIRNMPCHGNDDDSSESNVQWTVIWCCICAHVCKCLAIYNHWGLNSIRVASPFPCP